MLILTSYGYSSNKFRGLKAQKCLVNQKYHLENQFMPQRKITNIVKLFQSFSKTKVNCYKKKFKNPNCFKNKSQRNQAYRGTNDRC